MMYTGALILKTYLDAKGLPEPQFVVLVGGKSLPVSHEAD
jgi:hypothetical protein